MRSDSTTLGTPPSSSRHSASNRNVVAAVVVADPLWPPLRPRGPHQVTQYGPLYGPVVTAAHLGGSPVAAHLSVGGDHVHVFPLALQNEAPSGRCGAWLAPTPWPTG